MRIVLDLDPHREASSTARPLRVPPPPGKFPRLFMPPVRFRSAPMTLTGAGIRPRSWQEAYWLAGQADAALYLARHNRLRQAIRSTGGLVEARRFARTWKAVGRVKPLTEETEHAR